MKSLDIEPNEKPKNLYGPGGAIATPPNTARTYFMFGLALFVFYGVGKMLLPADNSDDEWASKGDPAGGWGTEHNHPIRTNLESSGVSSKPKVWNDPPVKHYHEKIGSRTGLEMRETDLLAVISPLVFVPSHSRPEYEKYQIGDEGGGGALVPSPQAEVILYDKKTPHGMAFEWLVNRDTRPLNHNDNDVHLIQRFVLTLLFYTTGGKDEATSTPVAVGATGGRTSGWDPDMAHFLTGLHECHWVKKSLEDQFWGILSIESESDRRVGVTKCNADMEVTEIRLADLNLVGFIPEEIKWLSSLESFDIQNNHLAGPIPKSLGELDELRYLSLDGNNFSGTIPDVFDHLMLLERAYLNFNDFNGAMPPSLCTLREEGVLEDLWSDCGGYPITCTCCTVCCDMVAECNEMESQKGG